MELNVSNVVLWTTPITPKAPRLLRCMALTLETQGKEVVDKLPSTVIASDRRHSCRRERGNLCLAVYQRIEIAAAT